MLRSLYAYALYYASYVEDHSVLTTIQALCLEFKVFPQKDQPEVSLF